MKKGYLILVGLISSYFSYAQSNTPELTDSIRNLKEVVVTATKVPTSGKALPYASALVNEKTLKTFQYRTTPEALSGVTGLFIQKTNHGGGSPFLRGLTGNQILILVDGIRLNNATFRYGPNQYLNTIDVYALFKIEVVKGTGSVQYGSDAMGGVIQVFTKEPGFSTKPKLNASATLKTISQKMEFTSHGEVGFESKKLGILVAATFRDFGDLVGGDTTGKQWPSGYKENAFNGKIKYQLSPLLLVSAAYQYMQQRDVNLYHKVELENFEYYTFSPQERQMGYLKFERTVKNKILKKIIFNSSFQQNLETRNYHKKNNIARFTESDKVKTIGLTLDFITSISENWTSNGGIEFYHDKVNSKKEQTILTSGANTLLRGLYPDNSNSSNISIYTLHHIKIKKLVIESGLRYNHYQIQIKDTAIGEFSLNTVKLSPSSLVGNLGLIMSVSKNQQLYFSFSTCYRMPNIDDMGTLGLVDFRYEIPAYNLQPEKTYNYEIGYHGSFQKLKTSICAYYMHLNNLVTRIQVPGAQVGGYKVYIKENSQSSYIYGSEAALEYQLNRRLVLITNASYTFGQNTSKNEPMRRIPPLNGRILLTYSYNQWQLSIENNFAGHQIRLATGDKEDNRIPVGGTPGWNVLNFYAAFNLPHISIQSGLQNIFNTDYRTHGSGINGMGRSVFISIQLNQ